MSASSRRGDEAGAGEEQRRLLRRRPASAMAAGAGRRRVEDGGRADGERERERVAEPVGEEQLGHRQAPVVGADGEHRSPRTSPPSPRGCRGGASRPWAGRSCPSCRARTPASRPWWPPPAPRPCRRRTPSRGRARRRRRRRPLPRRRRRAAHAPRSAMAARWPAYSATARPRRRRHRPRSPPARPPVSIVDSGTGTTPERRPPRNHARKAGSSFDHQRDPLPAPHVEVAQGVLGPPDLALHVGVGRSLRPRRSRRAARPSPASTWRSSSQAAAL